MRRFAGIAISACVATIASRAAADGKTAADYFADGQKQMTLGAAHYAEACIDFEEALALAPGVGVKFNLADCYDKTRRPTRALPLFRDVENITQQVGQLDRSATAKERADAVARRIPKIVVRAPWAAAHPDATFALDGQMVKAGSLGTPFALDFGTHVLIARLGGIRSEASVDLETDGQIATLDIAEPGAVTPAKTAAIAAASTTTTTSTTTTHQTQRNVGWIVGGAGVLAVAIGSVVALAAKSRYSSITSDDECTSSHICTKSSAVADVNSARSEANAGGVVDIVGLVLVAAGVTLWATAPSDQASVAVTPSVGLNHATLVAVGTF